MKTLHGQRIVALNTNLYYTSNKAILAVDDPGDQLAWLNTTLAQARTDNEKVSAKSIEYKNLIFHLKVKVRLSTGLVIEPFKSLVLRAKTVIFVNKAK